MSPENGWFAIGISFSRGLFSGDMLVSGRVNFIFFDWPHEKLFLNVEG